MEKRKQRSKGGGLVNHERPHSPRAPAPSSPRRSCSCSCCPRPTAFLSSGVASRGVEGERVVGGIYSSGGLVGTARPLASAASKSNRGFEFRAPGAVGSGRGGRGTGGGDRGFGGCGSDRLRLLRWPGGARTREDFEMEGGRAGVPLPLPAVRSGASRVAPRTGWSRCHSPRPFYGFSSDIRC
jgi:hypothetical protein